MLMALTPNVQSNSQNLHICANCMSANTLNFDNGPKLWNKVSQMAVLYLCW